ncbi:hypothetical protein AVEN_46398-1 [Araneus ventricosus]|uniref:Uncharacterized protein n=1 Tax=Araneus ventricosus TaxID=182803 RepID=A0A4Y2JM50_ARAVE|nr:hypothetical protein AVEN_46398-1 [Araneus ventricosus]
MELLKKLNAFSALDDFKRMSDLNIDEKYPVSEIKSMKNKFGNTIVVKLDDCQVSLPQRCGERASDCLKLNEIKPLFFVYSGAKDVGKSKPAHLFRFEQ